MATGLSAQTPSSTPFGPLLLAVFSSIVEVFILCSAGYILAKQGILDKKTQKQLNRLNVSLFTPALLFSKVAFYLTPTKLKELWVIPLWFFIVTLTSMGVGKFLGWSFRLRRSQKSFVMAAAMFMNSNALPIALMQSLVASVPDLKWGSHDEHNAMLGRALTYLTMYSTLGMVVRYSYGVNLLARADTVVITDETTPLLAESGTETLQTTPSHTTLVGHTSDESTTESSDSDSDARRPIRRSSSAYRGCPPPSLSGLPPPRSPSIRRRNTPFFLGHAQPTSGITPLPTVESPEGSDTEGDVEDGLLPTRSGIRGRSSGGPIRHFFSGARRYVKKVWQGFYDFMTVPLWSALFSLLVACIDPLKHALQFHLQPLNNAINTSGKCAVPLTLVVLGAYFYIPPEEGAKSKSAKQWLSDLAHWRKEEVVPYKTEITKPGENKTVALAVAARMIITPILLTPVLVFATRFDWHAVFEDPVFVVVNIILLASPPALTLAQITQAVSGEAFERLISGTIFWSYCILTPPIAIASVLTGLVLAKL